MQKTKNQSFGNVYFLNEKAKDYYLEQIAIEKLNEIEIATSMDFTQNFEQWVKSRSDNELLLIWAVLHELLEDSEHLQSIVDRQIELYAIPEWLALSGTLAFFSVHFLNKFLIELEFIERRVDFDFQITEEKINFILNNSQIISINRSFLRHLKENIYQDQLNKEFFLELADTIISLTIN